MVDVSYLWNKYRDRLLFEINLVIISSEIGIATYEVDCAVLVNSLVYVYILY